MGWLLRHNGLWSVLAFLLGAVITWLLLSRRDEVAAEIPADEPVEEKADVLVGAAASATDAPSRAPDPVVRREPAVPEQPDVPEAAVPEPAFSRRMEAEENEAPTLFDDDATEPEPEKPAVVPPGRYGEGSADAVPHQGPPDGFTIKGNAHSMLFHTPDSPYYGRTKPEVWFRTESDAERAGFTKYTRRPRKSAKPRD